MNSDVERLRERASRVPGGAPVLDRARVRAEQAVNVVRAAVAVDPTLLDDDRRRNIDLIDELLRQLRPLAQQAGRTLEHARLTAAGAPREEIAQLGRINPFACNELDALSEHVVILAETVEAEALPDWNTPHRIRERSERLLPDPDFLAALADQLRRAVRPALELDYPAHAAQRLAALADQLDPAADDQPRTCAAPGCSRELHRAVTGRRRTYCGPTCRQRAHRTRHSSSERNRGDAAWITDL